MACPGTPPARQRSLPCRAGACSLRSSSRLRTVQLRRRSKYPSGPGRARSRLTCQAAASNGWPLWSALAACSALSQVVERRTPVGAVLSAPLVSMAAALALAALGLIPTAAPAYDAVWLYIMPLAAALCLLESDLRKLWSSAATTLVAFLIGAAGTVLGTAAAFWLFGHRLGPEGYKVAAALCASYIGGSVNFAAVAQALSLAPGPLLAGAMTADNVAMAAYIAVIMSIPAEEVGRLPPSAAGSPSKPADGHASQQQQEQQQQPAQQSVQQQQQQPAQQQPAQQSAGSTAPAFTAESAALALAAAAAACTLGNGIASAAGFGSGALAVMALLSSGLAMGGAALAKRWSGGAVATPFAGAEALGGALMMLFFATIGAGAGSLSALRGCGWLLAFISVQLGVHLAVCIGGGRLLRLPMRSILVASNANVGGSATAAAMASSKHWHDLVQPAMLTGSLGYAIATAIGTAVGLWLRTWQLG